MFYFSLFFFFLNFCSSRWELYESFPAEARLTVYRRLEMTRRAFSAKQCSESNSAAAGILRSSAAAHFLSNSGEEACFRCSGARSSESDRGIVFRPRQLARARLCAGWGEVATIGRARAPDRDRKRCQHDGRVGRDLSSWQQRLGRSPG